MLLLAGLACQHNGHLISSAKWPAYASVTTVHFGPCFMGPSLRFEFCTECAVKWHEGSSCEDYQAWRRENVRGDEAFEELHRRLGAKSCPRCRNAATKEDPSQCNKVGWRSVPHCCAARCMLLPCCLCYPCRGFGCNATPMPRPTLSALGSALPLKCRSSVRCAPSTFAGSADRY